MFKAIARSLLSARQRPAPNPRQAVDEFRAKKRAEGLTEAEISAVLVASRIATEGVFIAGGWSDKAIDGMNWARLFENPPAPLPARNWVIYPQDWRAREAQYRRRGWPDHTIHEVLQGIGAWQQRNAQPPGLLGTLPHAPHVHVESRGSRAESLARLIKQGYTENEITQIFDARIRTGTGLGVGRYPHLEEEGPLVALFGGRKKTATRPHLRLVASTAPPPP